MIQEKTAISSRREILCERNSLFHFSLNIKYGGQATYVYVFDHRPVFSPMPDWIGVARGIEPVLNMMVAKYSETEKGLSLYIMKLWTDFVKYG